MRGLEGTLYDAGQIVVDRVQVDGVLQTGGERGHGLVGVPQRWIARQEATPFPMLPFRDLNPI